MILQKQTIKSDIQTNNVNSNLVSEKIMNWLHDQSLILSLGKTMKVQIHIKGNDVKGDITIFPDHC